MNFAVSADHKVKMKESKKSGEIIDLVSKLKKLWNMKVTVIQNGMVPHKSQEKRLGGGLEVFG